MKTAILSVVAARTLFSLIDCSNHTEVEVLQPTRAAELKPMQQSWRGILPYADYEGIETSLFLEEDGIWVMNERYQDVRDEPSSFTSYGTWARTTNKLVLTDSKGEKSYYRAKSEVLGILDREDNPIESQFNYTLQPVFTSLPVTPTSMRGMYFYMADAAIFTDYTTGKRVPVANDAQPERDYLAARVENRQPALLTLEAHFTLGSNPDTGGKMRTLMADKDARFIPGKACNQSIEKRP